MGSDADKRDEVLTRMLKTPPTPHKQAGKPEKGKEVDIMPTDPDEMIGLGKKTQKE